MHEYSMQGSSQDSLVVCRLKKNVEFRSSDTSSRASLKAQISGNAASESGIDRTGVSEGDKAAECSKKCSSSNDSYSIEQLESATECEQKLSNEITLAESSSVQKNSDEIEDLYADILKDDIVKLDESPLFNVPEFLPVVASSPATENSLQHRVSETLPLQASPFPGTANQRMKLKKPPFKDVFESIMKVQPRQKEKEEGRPTEPPKCVFSLLSRNRGLIPAVSVTMVFLVLLLSLLGGSQQVKRIAYATMYKMSWH